MKKTMRKNIIACLSASLFICVLAFFGVCISKTSVNAQGIVIVSEMKGEYSLGEKLTLSDDAAIQDNGKTYIAANAYLVYPDGTAYTGKEFTLNKIGRYSLVLEANGNDGKKITASKEFSVNKPYYGLSSNGTVEYGSLNSVFAGKGMAKGIIARLSDGETLSFAEPINVFDKTEVEIATFNLMTWSDDVEYLTVRLTDCYNTDVALEINYWVRYWNESSQMNETYITAGQKGFSAIGLAPDPLGTYTINGANYNKAIFGASAPGNRKKFDRRNNFTLIYENAEDGKVRLKFKTPESTDTLLITEINNDKLYTNVFPGFTNGDVFVSFTASGFKNGNTVAEVQIGDFYGKKNAALDKFTDGKPQSYVDKTAPIIRAAANEYDNKIAAGIAAKIPSATAIDESGISGEITYTVWYNYGTATQKSVNMSDGKFIPYDLGAYTIEYSAIDSYGNKGVKCITLTAVEKKADGISINVNELSKVPVGTSVNLADYELSSYCKEPAVTIKVTAPSGEISDATKNASAYGLYEVGEYTITYEFEDAYYSGAYVYKFSTVASNVPVFEKNRLSAPNYFIVGATYSIEKVKAYLYGVNGKQSAETVGYISYDGGEYEQIDAEEFVVKSGSTARLKLACKNSPDVYIVSEEAKIVNVKGSDGKLDISKYFAGDFSGSTSLDYTTYTVKKSGTATLDALNPVLSSAFAFTFSVTEKYKIDEIEILLTDYYDRSVSASVKLINEDNSATICEINGTRNVISRPWIGSKFTVDSDGNGNMRFGATSITANLGLSTDLCLVSVKFKGIAGDFKFDLYTFCNQSFGSVTTDNIRPMISADDIAEVMPLNSVVSTSIPCVADVLSPNSFKNCRLSVGFMDDDGNYSSYKNEDGLTYSNLSADEVYKIKLDKYGSYTISYKYTDGNGREQSLKRVVYVNDAVAPTIRFENVPAGTLKVGLNVSIKRLGVVVADNYTATDGIVIDTVVRDERGRFVLSTKGDSFTLTEKGRYTVRVRCSDKAGNYATVSYKIYAE